MLGRNLIYIFFLVDTPTGLCYYRDASGNVQEAPMDTSFPVNLRRAPGNWMNQEIGFMRNQHYFGFTRSYTPPQTLIDDAAYIVRTLTYRGRGIEVPLTMLIYKFNGNPEVGDPLYTLAYKGLIDLPKADNLWAEGVQVNLKEGGFTQLLKAYEKTMYEIPMDGSLPEHFKMNMDGMLFQDTFNYSIIGIEGLTAGAAGVPCAYLSNEGDNANIVHNNPTYETIVGFPATGDYYQRTQNYLMVSGAPITVRIQGSITVSSAIAGRSLFFELFLATSKSVTDPAGFKGLISSEYGTPVVLTGQQVYYFDRTITLDANERLFLMFSMLNDTDSSFKLIGGNFTLTFASAFPTTYPWCMSLFDIGKYLVQYICQDASINGQLFNYQFASQVLLDNLNLVATSGDSLRASGDSNYQRFYNAVQNNPNFPSSNIFFVRGPVFKTSLSDFFDSVNALLNTAMGTQTLPGQGETIFIEKKGYVFNAAVKNLDNGEVTEVHDTPALDLLFTIVRIGYEPQTYDQKAGKYAWNTTLELVSPLKSIDSKILEIICKYITDPYLIEKLRSNVGGTSTTRNNSDNAGFVINRDTSSFVYEKSIARFDSAVPAVAGNPGGVGNTNILLLIKQWLQAINLPVINGSYLSYSNAAAIFLFNQPALSGSSFNLHLSITGNFIGYPANAFTGLPADSTTIKLWINGVVLQSWTITASSPSTPISITLATTHAFTFKDSIYLTCDTSVNGTTTLASCTLTIDNGSPYLTAIGSNIEVDPGINNSVLSLPNVTAALDGNGRPVISSGFQYFQFNSVLLSPNFDITVALSAVMNGGTTGQRAGFDLYLNGVPVFSQVFTRNAAILNQGFGFLPSLGSPTINRDFHQGDILFIVGSSENIDYFITDAYIQLRSTQIKAYNPKRVQYDAIYGIPTLLGNMPGTAIPITTGPGAPYNIEDITPARLARKHGNYFRSILWDQVPGQLKFSQLSKNQYLSTQLGSEVIVENANISISDLDKQLFKARYILYKARVQETFATIQTGSANAFVGATWNGIDASAFPWEMKQKTTLNEMQEWKMLAGPDFDFTTLINQGYDGLKMLDMKPNSLYCCFPSPVQFVPAGQVLGTKYHTKNRNLFWFNEQIGSWINQNNYWQPWQQDDNCNPQFITRDLTQLVINVYDCSGVNPIATIAAVPKDTPALLPGYYCWEVAIDLSAYAGIYYLTAVAGSGANIVTWISEGLFVKADWPNTLLFQWTHSSNSQSMIFDTGYSPSMRVQGFFDNMFKQKYKGSFYVDQPQDIKIINAIPYEITKLWLGLDDGIPYWVFKKLARILLFDGCVIEQEAFSLDENAEWEETFIEGNPKKFHAIDIRPSRSTDGISQDINGFIDDTVIMVSVDAGAAGPNAGNAGSTSPNIQTISIS